MVYLTVESAGTSWSMAGGLTAVSIAFGTAAVGCHLVGRTGRSGLRSPHQIEQQVCLRLAIPCCIVGMSRAWPAPSVTASGPRFGGQTLGQLTHLTGQSDVTHLLALFVSLLLLRAAF
jgi:hypothetical protein